MTGTRRPVKRPRRTARADAPPALPRSDALPRLTRRGLLVGLGVAPIVGTVAALWPEEPALIVPGRATADDAPSPIGPRAVARVVEGQRVTDGAGVRLRRSLGGAALPLLDPFLLLDEFRTDDPNDYLAGFPLHPHRGFETVTYMIHGAMEHRDSVGNHGRLGPGGAQWMTAGRGIVHSEMPKQERGLMWGFQLWVNLPAARKFVPPRYQDIPPAAVAELAAERARHRVVAGHHGGAVGPVSGIEVDPIFVDVALEPRGTAAVALPAGHAAFAYVTAGAAKLGATGLEVREGHLAVFGPGTEVALAASGSEARVLVVAGRPIGEPVARRGPFVMNTAEEIEQAFDDYRTGRLTEG